ncbi:MAG: hypothetical protein JWN95_508 [Frankiales bacterium]|nr:hypothetical protein [Frankiales bacterium]
MAGSGMAPVDGECVVEDAVLQVLMFGRIRALVGEAELDLGPPGRCALWSVLVGHANRPVSRTHLIDAVWGEQAPGSAPAIVHTYVSALRKALAGGGLGAARLSRHGDSYQLRLAEDECDVTRAEAHWRAAEQARQQGRGDVALAELDACAGLMYGVPLDGVPGPHAEDERSRLIEFRLEVQERRAEAQLSAGLAELVCAELGPVVAQYPLRESTAVLLIRALHQAGRRVEAIGVFDRVAQALDSELGIDVGPQLRRARNDVDQDSRGDATGRRADGSRAGPAPAQLPARTAFFLGRENVLAQLDRWLAETREGARHAGVSPVCTIVGGGGMGKTEVAVAFGDRSRDHFPDGQLFLDLRGFHPGQPPLPSMDALAVLLRGLGVAADRIPVELDVRQALYHQLLADQRILIVLDNALNRDQVLPLIPPAPGVVVVVTSRNEFAVTLDRVLNAQFQLDTLAEHDARQLLQSILDQERTTTEPAGLDRLITLCGGLPLAIRIAAERLAISPDTSLSELADELDDEKRRLDMLSTDDDEMTNLRAIFSWSYRALTFEAAQAFRRLGLHPGQDFDLASGAAVIGTSDTRTRHLLQQLQRAHLLNSNATAGGARYQMHDLVRVYATERAEFDEPERQLQATSTRLIHWFTNTAINQRLALGTWGQAPDPLAMSAEVPAPLTFGDPEAALGWAESERDTLSAVHAIADRTGDYEASWRLAWGLYTYDTYRSNTEYALTAQTLGAKAAKQLENPSNIARFEMCIGQCYWGAGEMSAAEDHARAALDAIRRTDQIANQLQVLGTIIGILIDKGDLPAASQTAEELQQLPPEFWAHHPGVHRDLCYLNYALGNYDEALSYGLQSITEAESSGELNLAALSQWYVGKVHRDAGRPDDALAVFQSALQTFRNQGDEHSGALVMEDLAVAHQLLGNHAEATDAAQAAVSMLELLSPYESKRARNVLAEIAECRRQVKTDHRAANGN